MREPYAHRRAHVHRHALTAGESALEIRDFDAVDTGNLGFLLHMRKKIVSAPYLLLSLFTSLNLCSGKFGQPITDDVRTLALLKQNIPSDYEIPVQYIPKELAGRCWVVLNIYPLEQSLRRLSDMFGAISSNKDNIVVFIAMLKSLRFTFDHEELEHTSSEQWNNIFDSRLSSLNEPFQPPTSDLLFSNYKTFIGYMKETAMQLFQCHYQEGSFLSGLYFDYINDVLNTASEETSSLSCKPPPCLNSHTSPGSHEGGHPKSRIVLLFLLIPITACVVLVVWLVKSKRPSAACNSENNPAPPSDTISSVSISVPLQTIAHHRAAEETAPEHQSG